MKISVIIYFCLILSWLGCNENNKKELIINSRHIDSTGKFIIDQKKLDPSKTAIVIVDMWHQGGHGYINADGSFTGTNEGFNYQETVCDSINETISAARSLGFTIIHTPADQAYIYKDHPARKNVERLTVPTYPWKQKPGWNDEQQKIPFSGFSYEYEYAYPYTNKDRNRPGTLSYGQNPKIVIAETDYITDDVDELWKIIQSKHLTILIYLGGSTNMCLAGRPYGALNMIKYGMDVLVDRNYTHLVHRIPNGWNGDIKNPRYGPFYTNERNSVQVIAYFEKNICPSIDGADIISIAKQKGGFTINKPLVTEANPDLNHLNISFQTQLIEVNPLYNIDIGWAYTSHKNGLTYGWNRLKVKDAIREGFDPVHHSYINATKGDWWKMQLPGSAHNCILQVSGKGILLINGKKHPVTDSSKTNIKFSSSGNISLNILSGEIKFYELLINKGGQ